MTDKIKAEDVYTQAVGDVYDDADVSRNPLSRDTLLELAAQHGVGKDSLVLDVGCANGGVSRKLLEKTGCKIEGVELLPLLVDMGNKQNQEAGVADRFTIQQGSITAIPFPDNHFDFVFCDDVMGMVDDLDTAMAECRRVLKPSGKMLVYLSFPTERMAQAEADFLEASLGGARDSMLTEPELEPVISNYFSTVTKETIGSQFTQYDTEKAGDVSEATKGLLRVARLLTWRDQFIEKHGEQAYRIALAGSHWSVFILLGKLNPTAYILEPKQ